MVPPWIFLDSIQFNIACTCAQQRHHRLSPNFMFFLGLRVGTHAIKNYRKESRRTKYIYFAALGLA